MTEITSKVNGSSSDSSLAFVLVGYVKQICFDYTPSWGRGNPRNFIDNVTFPRILTDKTYQYRIISGGKDLGVRNAPSTDTNGSQRLNFLEWNSGYGIRDSTRIQVYMVDPDNGNQLLIAQWQ